MQETNPWLLPDGIEETLPNAAQHLEVLRHRLLELFGCWGYALVIPPFIDFLESLLTGSGHDLDLQTFKLTDQISGRMLGIRADMTPQVARIDAHNLKQAWPTRLCYAGTVLHTRGDPLEKTRSPMQIGAELYGHTGLESDWEVLCLMLEMLAIAGLKNVHLDLGHVGIYRALAAQAGLSGTLESELFAILQRKAKPELSQWLAAQALDESLRLLFLALPELNGGVSVLAKAETLFSDADAATRQALAELVALANKLAVRFPHLPVSFDLAELRGYHYHTGIVFAAFVPGVGREIARGGRYDNIGQMFGRARPATGFSADLKVLSALARDSFPCPAKELIFAPTGDDVELTAAIRDLRAQNRAVVQQLPGQEGGAAELGCTAILDWQQQQWVVNPLT